MTTLKKSFMSVVAALLPAMTLWADSVAKVGDTEYESLSAAVNAITSEDQTIVLLTDLTGTLTVSKGFVLDLNNHGISGLTIEGGNVVVNDNSSEQGGYIKKTGGYAVYVKGGSVEVKGGTISGLTYGIFGAANTTTTISGGTVANTAATYTTETNGEKKTQYGNAIFTNGTLNIKGGAVSSKGIYAVRLGNTATATMSGGEVSAATQYAVLNNSTQAFTMTGGIITAPKQTVYNNNADGSIVVSGGKIEATASTGAAIYIAKGSAQVSGTAEITSGMYDFVNAGNLTISGGKMTATAGIYAVTSAKTDVLTVTGGLFNKQDSRVLQAIDNDYMLTESSTETGYYEVAQRDVMAKIGDAEYRSLASAIAAASDGDVITLTRDVTDGAGIAIPDGVKKTVTLDFANHTYTVLGPAVGSKGYETQAVHLAKGSTMTMKNGTLNVAAQATGILMLMQNYSDLTLDGMNIDATNVPTTYSIMNFNTGKSVLKGNTTITMPEGAEQGILVHLADAASGLTIEGGEGNDVKINGRMTVNGTNSEAALIIKGGTFSDFVVSEGTTAPIAISGGTFSTPIDLEYCAEGYIPQKNDDGTYSVKQGTSALLRDGEAYTVTEEKTVDVATYKRSFGEERVGKFLAWFVPFDYTVTDDDAKKFKFYKVNMIANSAEPGESSEMTEQFWIFLSDMAAGDKLVANKPYIFKPLAEAADYEFTTENAMLKAPATDSRLSCATTTDNYDFYGVYESATPSTENPFYYMNINGQISLGNDGSKVQVGSYRWIIRVTAKNGTSANYARAFVFVEPGDNTTTGISSLHGETTAEAYYTIDGKQTFAPVKGISIVRTADGKVKKVVKK